MKDMSVEELLQKLYDGYESKIHAEILRRFEALERENARLRYVINGTPINPPKASDPSNNMDTY